MLIMSRHEGVSFHVMSIYQYKYVTIIVSSMDLQIVLLPRIPTDRHAEN